MATVREIYDFLNEKAPFSMQMSFDNAGLLVGREGAAVDKLLIALDITEPVIDEAVSIGAQLIVSHHPVIFDPPKSVTDGSILGRKLMALIEGGVAAICAHTNLDAVQGGVNDILAQRAGLVGLQMLAIDGTDGQGAPYGIGRAGHLRDGPLPLPDYAAFLKKALCANGVRYADGGRPVSHVAVGGGSCGSMLGAVAALGCDTFVTADVKYDVFLDARALGINLIDAGHYPTEQVVCPVLAQWIRDAFPHLTVVQSAVHCEISSYL